MSVSVGLDIGYSNLKICVDKSGTRETIVLPAGAAPEDLMTKDQLGRVNPNGDYKLVQIEGNRWVSGVEPLQLQSWTRELHSDYIDSDAYLALFYGALLAIGEKEIDVLVTGLPVNQALDKTLCQKLRDKLIGEHQVTPKRSFKINDVVVLAQPTGAYMSVLDRTSDNELMELFSDGRVVVIDPGFYSVDWVALQQGRLRDTSSGTSLDAMSRVLECADSLIRVDHGSAPGIDFIEQALRSGKGEDGYGQILMCGEKVDLKPYLLQASEEVAPKALSLMKNKMRDDGGIIADVLLLAGGGGRLYESAARSLYPKGRVVIPESGVASIAEGYCFAATTMVTGRNVA